MAKKGIRFAFNQDDRNIIVKSSLLENSLFNYFQVKSFKDLLFILK